MSPKMIDWTEFYGTQPGYERVKIGDHKAARIGTHEAIYLAQQATRARNNQVYIETAEDKILNFPTPVPSTRVNDVVLDFHLEQDRGVSHQLNPLLSPSLNHYREQFPSFFNNEEKYLTTTRLNREELDGLNQLDRVAISGVSFEQELGESLTIAVVSMYLRQQGYIVDRFNESLATPGSGHPDLFAVKLPEYQQKLAEEGITNGGFYLNELELPEFDAPETPLPEEEEAVVLEIESVRKDSFYDAKDETGEYLSGGWFDRGYGVRGFGHDRVESWRERLDVGFITFDSSGEFTIVDCPKEYGRTEKTAEVKERVRTIVKLALLKNSPLKDVVDFLGIHSFYEAVPAARKTNLDDVLAQI